VYDMEECINSGFLRIFLNLKFGIVAFGIIT
jgi:hypothetical protein